MKIQSKSYLLYSLALMLAAAPFIEKLKWGAILDSALITVVLLMAMFAVSKKPRDLAVAAALVTPAVLGRWLNHVSPHLVPYGFVHGFAILFIGYVAFHLIRFIFESPHVDSEVLCVGIATYLILGLLWAAAYALVDQLVPGSFMSIAGDASMSGFKCFYFSFVTLATVGYGDFAPVSNVARMLAMMEGIVGIFYTTVLISRLVALYSSSHGAFGHARDHK